ncbi:MULTISPECIES: PTS lactose/cellobiose transporter subunit IIA [Bacillus amyloliquefaciens group]|uniref:PTS lactose/cellobiose transporter subunit IIA n=1 Tax=Bacillus amyloliquefaciens group TaxID=1938374 RepID=UPI000DF3B15A|nr:MULTISPECIES: PTS lactose/cellobiose transporter subunit IIA [Bacillus amyloliquefaciens group]NRF35110.1 PTS lactose/cellobiose transporter subunit IIA [Bacillus velezensis]RCX33854.1 PTS system cellobiose-specific IIA component [Bacillus amyloliquefaciens]
METYTDEQISFQLILHSGNARSNIIQSIRAYKDGRTDESDTFLTKAEEELGIAHDIHFQMIQKEAGGAKTDVSLLFMHAEDHLMSALSMKELVKEMLDLFQSKNL